MKKVYLDKPDPNVNADIDETVTWLGIVSK
jgi:hypothetical protein